MGDDDLTRHTIGNRTAFLIDQLDDNVIRGNVHATLGTLMRDEACISAAVSIGDRTAEYSLYIRSLLIVEALGGNKRNFYTELAHVYASTLGVARDQRQGRWVTE
jgi:hypothetical protein